MTTSASKVSIGWVLISYFMITGGFLVAASVMGMMHLTGEWVGYGVFFLGAAFGGLFAARASPGTTIIEPALGGVLFIVSFIGLFAAVPGSRAVFAAAGGTILKTALSIGFITGLGGLVGAMIGERTAPAQRSTSGLRWMGLAALITLGVLFFLALLIGIVLVRSGSFTDGAGPGLILLVGTALVGGAVTQAAAPRKMLFACGSGFFVVCVVVVGLAGAQGAPMNGSVVGGLLIVGLIGTLVGALGAKISWGMFGDRIQAAVAAEQGAGGNIPPARLQQ